MGAISGNWVTTGYNSRWASPRFMKHQVVCMAQSAWLEFMWASGTNLVWSSFNHHWGFLGTTYPIVLIVHMKLDFIHINSYTTIKIAHSQVSCTEQTILSPFTTECHMRLIPLHLLSSLYISRVANDKLDARTHAQVIGKLFTFEMWLQSGIG